MKSIRTVAIILGFVLIPCLFTLADEQAAQLPEDGWWIRYTATSKREFVNGEVQESTSECTYSLVGTLTEDGEKCRWVELNVVCSFDEKEYIAFYKYLVSEKDLLESEQLPEKLKRVWWQSPNGDVREVRVGDGRFSFVREQLSIFPGRWQKAERVDKDRVIDFQQGRLTISDAKTQKPKTIPMITVNKPGRSKNEDRKNVEEATAWFDRTTSPVYAAAKFQTKVYVDHELKDTTETDVVLEDYGTGAKSELPDNN